MYYYYLTPLEQFEVYPFSFGLIRAFISIIKNILDIGANICQMFFCIENAIDTFIYWKWSAFITFLDFFSTVSSEEVLFPKVKLLFVICGYQPYLIIITGLYMIFFIPIKLAYLLNIQLAEIILPGSNYLCFLFFKNIIYSNLLVIHISTILIFFVIISISLLISILFLTNNLQFNVYQLLFIKYFHIIEQIIRDLITNKIGKEYYYSFLMLLFIFINLCNLHSLIPYSYAITSNFAVTFTLSFIFFLTLNLTGILYHGIHILNLFFPSGTPFIILPLLIIIEFISYLARMFSLAIRLFANITAGHILLKILSWFTYLLKNVFFIAIIISIVISSLWVLEFFISILQAYVFLILLCIYVNEVLQLH